MSKKLDKIGKSVIVKIPKGYKYYITINDNSRKGIVEVLFVKPISNKIK